jgi:ribosomal protein S18
MDQDEKFRGFVLPRSNFFSLPNQWTDITYDIKSLAELKVIEYVLRHTWGFHEGRKRITHDEFMNGRKYTNGTRMDRGTGLSDPSIREGIRLAIEHGYLEQFVDDDSDKARVKRSYGPRMEEGNKVTQSREKDSSPPDKESLSRGEESLGREEETLGEGEESLPRSEKDTLERYLGKEEGLSNLRLPSEDRSKPDSSKLKKKPEPFDYKAVEELQRVIATKVKINCRMNKEKEAQHIRLMREHDKVPKEDIRRVIRWYSEHIHDEYAIEAYSAGAFRRKYQEKKFAAAMARNGHAKPEMTDHLKTVSKVASRYFNEVAFEKPTRVQLDPLLESMGLEPGSVTPDEVWNGKW